jgi:hypothetical protein
MSPVSPDRKKLILFGMLAGAAGGLGLVILKDNVDDSVKSVEMAKLFGLPVLAVIPRIEDPRHNQAQAGKDRVLYLSAGLYYLVILVVFALEVLGKTDMAGLLEAVGRLKG